jgi:uncharacterized hydrophobic protein (TIGR00271 family)
MAEQVHPIARGFPRLTGELRTQDEIRDAVYLFSGDVAAKQSRFWLLLLISAVIATAGIIGDSTATVIGAMFVAPLGTPIQGLAAALADGDGRHLTLSAALVAGAALAVILIGAVLAVVLPELHTPADNSQITGRVAPTIVDLVAAAATGLAGAVAVSRRDIGDILPGVAIAISLVPPLAVVGVTASEGDWSGSLGALLLFLTNVMAMVVVGALVFGAVAGLRSNSAAAASFRRRRAWAVVLAGAVVVVGALAIATFRTVQLNNRRADGARIATRWARDNGGRLLQTRYEGDRLVFVVESDSARGNGADLLARLRGAIPAGTTVVVNRVGGDRHDIGAVP